MQAGPRQHFLPAGYLGGFSAQPASPRRNSMLWVRRRGVADPFQQRASNLAVVEHLYTLDESPTLDPEGDRALIDRLWTRVENDLAPAIDALVDRNAPLDADTWLGVLVPFAAQVFVRGADWAARFAARFGPLAEGDDFASSHIRSNDNVNMARAFELQRLYAPMMAAGWTVLHCPPGSPLIVNDVARIATIHVDGTQGYTIPLRADKALALMTAEAGPRVYWTSAEQRWLMRGIEHVDLTKRDVDGLNHSLREGALNEAYGPTEELLRPPLGSPRSPEDDPVLDATLLVPSPQWARAREHDLYKLLTITSRPPGPGEDRDWGCSILIMPQ